MVTAAPASASTDSSGRDISTAGTTSITDASLGEGAVSGPELAGGLEDAGSADPNGASPTLPTDRSQTSGESERRSDSGETTREDLNPQLVASFDGLNHFAQRFANNANQFSVEPPDQGLCAGNGYVLETVNDVMAVYNSAGTRLKGPVDLNTFYGYPAALIRPTGVPRGPEVTDPSCYFDSATQRWFHAALTLEVVKDASGGFPPGKLTGANHVDIAVSQTANPLGAWTTYHVAVQDDGTDNTPNHHCSAGTTSPAWETNPHACLGDYPHIGADANGFYVTTNEYSFFGPEFKAAQIYAFSKGALAANAATVHVTQIDTTNLVRGNQAGFTVWPAESPNGQTNPPGDLSEARGGTEFFMSSNAAAEVNPTPADGSRDLIVWALTNTESLGSAQPELELRSTVARVGLYGAPPKSTQKLGPTPLADCLNDTNLPLNAAGTIRGCWRLATSPEPTHSWAEGQAIDTNDTRMQQVMFADGLLFGALDTSLMVSGKKQAGVEWFEVRPHVTEFGVHAQLVRQGYVGRSDTNLSYPAIAVNEKGLGAIAFTLLGPNDYPSAAYAPFDEKGGTGAIHVAAAGVGPDDGFTNYGAAFGIGHPRTRWGDYGAAVVDGSNIWMASEYIGQTCTFAQFVIPGSTCGGTRSGLANWGTRISEVSVSD